MSCWAAPEVTILNSFFTRFRDNFDCIQCEIVSLCCSGAHSVAHNGSLLCTFDLHIYHREHQKVEHEVLLSNLYSFHQKVKLSHFANQFYTCGWYKQVNIELTRSCKVVDSSKSANSVCKVKFQVFFVFLTRIYDALHFQSPSIKRFSSRQIANPPCALSVAQILAGVQSLT